MLTEFEREVLLRLAAEDARAEGAPPPFRLRPGLVAAILAFYDELRRRSRTVDSLDRIVGEKLAAGRDADRGAERLFRQTQFLAATFAAFERRVADSGRIDEHALRALLLSSAPPGRYRHIVVTVADQAAGLARPLAGGLRSAVAPARRRAARHHRHRTGAGVGLARAAARCVAGDRGDAPGGGVRAAGIDCAAG